MRLIFTIFIMHLGILLFAQPANDECADRIQLGAVPLCPVMGTFTNVAATGSVISDDPTVNKPDCFSGSQPDNDVWFSFIVPADGSAPDLIIEVTPTTGANGPISQPQIAAYRGECGEDELAEVGCASAAFGDDMISLELFGLNPGNEIFLRIEDWTASATSNEGDFALCIKAPDPIFNIGEEAGSMLCNGQLFDSGGPDGPYGVNEDNQFVICPAENFSCIGINLESYATESGFDEINFYQGGSTADPLFISFDGSGGPTFFNIPTTTCVTVQFISDGSITDAGFDLSWSCSTGACENPFSTCAEPTVINSLPYQVSDLSTCGALDAVSSGPCLGGGLLDGEDLIFTYTSPGNECITAALTGANSLTALSIYNDCPEDASLCMGSDISAVGGNATVETFLEAPGTYYFVVDNPEACTDFDLAINSVNCPNNVPVSCENPVVVSVPFEGDASTCGAGDTEGNNNCNFNTGTGADYVYAYESPGSECLTVRLENASIGTSISALNGCASDNADCFGFSQVFLGDTAVIENVRIVDPGTYYFVVESSEGCSSFDISIIPIPCPIILPPAVNCENALNINGCGTQPQIINVDQMASEDETVVQTDINDGCWGGPGQARYTWFTFQAQADGNFGFLANNAEDPTISDIDIQVWGPYFEDSLACDVMRTTQPIRSTYASPRVPNLTGLTDIHPATGEAITDICEDAGGDAYVSTIQVLQGEWYLVLVNDFSGTIEEGGIRMDFSETTPGVLAEFGQMAAITPDTVTCPGIPVTIEVTGGVAYNWLNAEDGLSCVNCPNPAATVTVSTEFSVIVSDACNMDTLTVKVGVLTAEAGTDQMSCNGELIELSGAPSGAGSEGAWMGNTAALSCIACPNPTVDTELLGPGTYSYIYQVGTTDCASTDTVMVTILDAVAPDYTILADTSACEELTLSLGGVADPNATYSWTSNPPGFTSADANPAVTVAEPITYYLEVSNQTCPRVLMDSVTINIGMEATLPELTDQFLCPGRNYLFIENPEPGFSYSWSPAAGVGDPNSLSTNFFPDQTTTYTLTASQDGCTVQTSFTITVEEAIAPNLVVTDDLSACVGTEVVLDAVSNIPGTYEWSDGSNGGVFVTDPIIQNTTITVTFTPTVNCFAAITETINIMALGTPQIAEITAQDICSADGYQLNGLTVQPGVMYNWTPSNGVVNANELNASFNPTDTTTFQVIGNVGACADTAFFTLNVAESPVITVAPIVAVCAGSDVVLSASASIPGEFRWSPGGQTGPEITVNDVNADLVFTADFTADNGCTVPGEMVSLEVIDPPTIGAIADQTLCTDETYELSGLIQQPGVNYTWTPATGVADPNSLNNIFSPTVTTTYEITAAAGDCIDTQSFTINVGETPVLTASEIDPACPGSDVTLSASSTVPGEFTWTPFDLIGSEVIVNNVNTSLDFTANFVADNGCPVDGILIEMEVLPGLEITEITVNPAMDIVEGDMVELAVTTEPDSAVTYQWSSGGAGIIEAVTPLDVPESSYSVTVTGPNGCTDEGTISFVVEPARYGIPNAFRPNGRLDINNVFQVEISGGNIEVLSMKIWNRFGDLVHEGLGSSHGWDGLIDGKLAPSDVYMYATEIQLPDGSLVKEQGDLTLIR